MEVNLTCCSSGNLKLFSRQHHDLLCVDSSDLINGLSTTK